MSDKYEIRDVPGFEGLYKVTNGGSVFRVGRTVHRDGNSPMTIKNREVFRSRRRDGYYPARLYRNGTIERSTFVHAIVAEAFIGPRPAGMDVRHLDGDPSNNHVSNLAYGTRAENFADAISHGTIRHGSNHRSAKLDESKVRQIRAMWRSGERQCKIAEAFGVTGGVVSQILSGKSWKHTLEGGSE